MGSISILLIAALGGLSACTATGKGLSPKDALATGPRVVGIDAPLGEGWVAFVERALADRGFAVRRVSPALLSQTQAGVAPRYILTLDGTTYFHCLPGGNAFWNLDVRFWDRETKAEIFAGSTSGLSEHCVPGGTIFGDIAAAVEGSWGSNGASAEQEALRAAEECRAKRLSGEIKGYAESVRCSTPRAREAYARAGTPHMDLFELGFAYRLAVAERMDRGEVSEAEGQVLNAEMTTRINAEIQNRNTAAYQAQTSAYQTQAQAQAQQLQAYGVLLQGLGTWNASMQPPQQPTMIYRPGRTITCQPTGGSQFQCF